MIISSIRQFVGFIDDGFINADIRSEKSV